MGGEQYFKGKGGWNGNDCKWQEIWRKSGLQIPVQVGLVVLFFALGIMQWRTDDRWAEDKQLQYEREERRLNEIKDKKEAKARQRKAEKDVKRAEYEKEQERLRKEWEQNLAQIKSRNSEKEQQRNLRRVQERE